VLWTAPQHKVNQEGIKYGYKELALSIFYQAVLDAQAPGYEGSEARAWLEKSGLELLILAGVGVRPGYYRDWLASGCKARRWIRLGE
jgi:hypothetical protein